MLIEPIFEPLIVDKNTQLTVVVMIHGVDAFRSEKVTGSIDEIARHLLSYNTDPAEVEEVLQGFYEDSAGIEDFLDEVCEAIDSETLFELVYLNTESYI